MKGGKFIMNLTTSMQQTENTNKKKDSMIIRMKNAVIVSILSVLSVFCCTNYAAAARISTNVNNAFSSIYDEVLAVVPKAGIVAFAICFLIFLFSSGRTSEAGLQWAKRILVGVVAVIVAPVLMDWLSGFASSI